MTKGCLQLHADICGQKKKSCRSLMTRERQQDSKSNSDEEKGAENYNNSNNPIQHSTQYRYCQYSDQYNLSRTLSPALLNVSINTAAAAPVGRKWASITAEEKQLHKASPCSSCSSGYSFSSCCSFSFCTHPQPLPNCFLTYTQRPLDHRLSSLHSSVKRDVSVVEGALRVCTFKVLLD